MKKCKCVFFDRDGIVNKVPTPELYITNWKDFHLMPEFVDALRITQSHGYKAIIVSNQRAVAKGLISISEIEDMHRRLREILSRKFKLHLDDIIYCPHNPGECSCRKPQPGMLLNMAEKHNIELSSSWMIGDMETDVEAGIRAGCHTILVGRLSANSKAEQTVSSMEQLPSLLESVLL